MKPCSMVLRGHDDPFCSTSEINDGRARRLRCVHRRVHHRHRGVHRRRSNGPRRGNDDLSSPCDVICCCGDGGDDRGDTHGAQDTGFDR